MGHILVFLCPTWTGSGPEISSCITLQKCVSFVTFWLGEGVYHNHCPAAYTHTPATTTSVHSRTLSTSTLITPVLGFYNKVLRWRIRTNPRPVMNRCRHPGPLQRRPRWPSTDAGRLVLPNASRPVGGTIMSDGRVLNRGEPLMHAQV